MKTIVAAGDVLTRVRAEIDERLAQLRPAAQEYAQLLAAAASLEAKRAALYGGAASKRAPASRRASAPARASRGRAGGAADSGPTGATQLAIVAALEHGSHTVSELVVVTAKPGGQIRASLRPLVRSGAVARAARDGRVAYALTSAA
jgi:hypothetical protein